MPLTLEVYISDNRKMLKEYIHPGVRNLQIIELMKWKETPKDKFKVK